MPHDRERDVSTSKPDAGRSAAPELPPRVASALSLQRTMGNAAVAALATGRVLARTPGRASQGATLSQRDVDMLLADDAAVAEELVRSAAQGEEEAQFNEAVARYRRRRYLEAAQIFAELYRTTQRHEHAYNACRSYMAHERQAMRRPATRRRDQRAIDQAMRHFDAGASAYQRGEYDQAAEEFQQAHAAFPTAEVQWNLAMCYRRLGRSREAARALERYERLLGASGRRDRDRRRREAARTGGLADEDLAMLVASDAEAMESLVLEAERTEAQGQFEAGIGSYQRRDYRGAAQRFEAAQPVMGDEMLFNRAVALFRDQRPEQALPLFQRYFGQAR